MSKLPTLPDRQDANGFERYSQDRGRNAAYRLTMQRDYKEFMVYLERMGVDGPALADLAVHQNPEFLGLDNRVFRPMSWAAFCGSVEACQWLSERGVPLNQDGLHGELGLVHDAAMGKQGNAAGVLHWLAEQLGPQCLLEEAMTYGNALHVAALADNVAACAAILEIEPFAFHELDMAGKTPLECAMRRKGGQRPANAIGVLMAYQAREAAHQALSGRTAALPT